MGDRFVVEGHDEALVSRPFPADHMAALTGSITLPTNMTAESMRAQARSEELVVERTLPDRRP